MPDEIKEEESRKVPGEKTESPEPVGAILARARVARGWDVDDVDNVTHISPGWVLVVEHGDWKQYPSMVYAKGHVRVYADALELDVPAILAAFQKEWDAVVMADNEDAPLHSHPEIDITKPGLSPKVLAVSLAFVVLLIAFLVAVHYAIKSRTKESKEVTMINTPPVRPLPKLEVKPVSPPSPSAEPTSPLSSALLSQAGSGGQAAVPSSDLTVKPSLEVRMVALKNTWVAVSVDDGVVHRFHLKSGESHTLTGRNFLTFSTGIGDGLVLFVNGKRLGMAGGSDAPVLHRRITRFSLRRKKAVVTHSVQGPAGFPENPTGNKDPQPSTGNSSSPDSPGVGIMPLVPKTQGDLSRPSQDRTLPPDPGPGTP